MNSGLRISVSLGVNEELIADWTDTAETKIPVKYMYLSSWNHVRGAIQLRNIRNPDQPTELCVNNVGSFACVSTAEEYVAIGFGGHTTCGSVSCYIKQFSVVTSDERSCRDHNIPDHPKRYSAAITSINNL